MRPNYGSEDKSAATGTPDNLQSIVILRSAPLDAESGSALECPATFLTISGLLSCNQHGHHLQLKLHSSFQQRDLFQNVTQGL
jgi:hypothetical protein